MCHPEKSAVWKLVRMARAPLPGETKAAMMERLDTTPIMIDPGPLAGKFTSATKTAALGVAFIVAAVATFLVAILSGTDFPTLSLALWIVGWIILMVGLGFVAFARHIQVEKEARLEEEIFKTEPRALGIDYSTPRVVMVRCKYCGTLNAEDVSKCHSCGANL
jgi:uncharacterized membrane protein